MAVFKTVFQQTLRASFLLCFSSFVFNVFAADDSGAANRAQKLYSSQPDVTPELGKRGSYSVGVQTIQAITQSNLAPQIIKFGRPYFDSRSMVPSSHQGHRHSNDL